ncbi:uncharacterized protein I206_101131 [Kwoniella pini CBS 10737]|uniref:Uncharacterized protein n=1 Tax=Kwoniella pini CBS 10737 TaxID=1296096 RepID=A0A1B9IBR2_9TREE|nr:uncharacterized protein I206_00195 [Kwoniella pini CBS 10737]OCF52894.1 hypothetical protein I206_00195 [Kwoniella pini CBS 10737]
MGYTLQLQWSYTPPPGRQVSLADIVLPRVLESYSLHTPSRSTVQFRTYRSSFPTSSNSESSSRISRYLTTINTLPNPIPPGQIQNQNSNRNENLENNEDITYLFLDDRSVISGNILQTTQEIVKNQNQNQNQINTNTSIIQNEFPDQAQNKNRNEPKQLIEIDKDTLDNDGFEIIDIPKSNSSPQDKNYATTSGENGNDIKSENKEEEKNRKSTRFKCIVVKPTSNVQPLLQSLLSSFVMGYTKSAKSTASNTSSLPTPTPLPGSSLLLTVLTFNSLPLPFFNPNYKLRLKVFILPNPNATSIFLEVEYQQMIESGLKIDNDEMISICKEFLEGCLITGLNGTLKWIHLDQDSFQKPTEDEWEGIERNKKSIFALAKAMRESGFL